MKKYDYDYSKVVGFTNTTIQIIEDIVDALNEGEYEDMNEAINDVLDRNLIYYRDQWNILKDFCIPQEADFNYAKEELYNLIYDAIEETEE